MKRLYPVTYGIVLNYVKEDAGEWHFDVKVMRKMASYFLQQQQKDPKFIEKVYAQWTLVMKEFYRQVTTIMNKDLTSLSLKQLIHLFTTFSALFVKEWEYFIFIDCFDPEGVEIIKSTVKNKGNATGNTRKAPSDDAINILVAPEELSFVQQEELSLLTIAARIAHDKLSQEVLLCNDFSALLKNKKLRTYTGLLKKHTQEFYWYKNNYATIHLLTKDYFFKGLKDILNNKTYHEIIGEIDSINNFIVVKKQKKQALYQKYDLKKVRWLFSFFQRLSEIRDQRKKNLLLGVTTVKKILQEITHKTGFACHTLEYIHHEEMRTLTFSKGEEKQLRQRIKGFMWCFKEDTLLSFIGKDAEKLQQIPHKHVESQLTELKGFPASPGIVKGTVKVIDTVEEFSKMNKGDILVSAMTRPEFVPVLEKAAAIITNEGGVTCHAAVVSREMKIPCIVGTHVATKVLKDGDVVEIDAMKGIVRKVG